MILGGDSDKFYIDEINGTIFVGKLLDREIRVAYSIDVNVRSFFIYLFLYTTFTVLFSWKPKRTNVVLPFLPVESAKLWNKKN